MGHAESKEVTEDEKLRELRKIAEDKGPVAVEEYLQEHITNGKKKLHLS